MGTTSIKQLYIEDSDVTHAVRRNMRAPPKNMVCGEDNNYTEENEAARDDLTAELLQIG